MKIKINVGFIILAALFIYSAFYMWNDHFFLAALDLGMGVMLLWNAIQGEDSGDPPDDRLYDPIPSPYPE